MEYRETESRMHACSSCAFLHTRDCARQKQGHHSNNTFNVNAMCRHYHQLAQVLSNKRTRLSISLTSERVTEYDAITRYPLVVTLLSGFVPRQIAICAWNYMRFRRNWPFAGLRTAPECATCFPYIAAVSQITIKGKERKNRTKNRFHHGWPFTLSVTDKILIDV